VLFSGVFILQFFSCQQKEEISKATEENKASVRRLIDEAWNKGNLAVIDQILSPEYRLHIQAPGAMDREGYHQAVSMYRSAFPDFLFTIEDMVAEGDKVVIRATMTGTQEGELMGLPPSGKMLTMEAIAIRRFEDGKIVEEWVLTDMLGMMQQMGVVQMPGSP